MSDSLLKTIKKRIDHKFYTISDVMEFQIEFSSAQSIGKKEKQILESTVLDSAKHILSVGELPQHNPDFEEYSSDGNIDDKKLLEYLDQNCYYHIQPLDVKSNHVILVLDLKMIFLNFSKLAEDHLKKIPYVKIKSFMGESEIGKKKKSVFAN